MSKTTKEDCRTISIYQLRTWGCLTGFYSGMINWTSGWSEKKNSVSCTMDILENHEMNFNLNYTITDRMSGEKKDINHNYPILTTQCNYGGKRYWFECSVYNHGRYCGRRVAKLYLGSGSNYFACRHCYNLSYESRNVSGYGKTLGQIVSVPELDELKEKIKRRYYKGKETKRYMRYLKKEEKFYMQLLSFEKYLTRKKK